MKISRLKYLCCAVLLAGVVLFATKIQVHADDTVIAGDLDWMLTADGVLTIYGDGVLSADDWDNSASWDYADQVTTIIIEEGITGLEGDYLLSYLNVTEVYLPRTLESMDSCDRLFFECYALENIYVDSNNSYYSSIDGVLYNKDATVLIYVPMGKTGTITVADTTVEIGDAAFYSCIELENVELPEGLQVIGDGAFIHCYAELSLPSTLTTIGDSAFYESTCLQGDIVIPAGVTSIGECAFLYCTSITNIIIEGNITRIEDLTFGHTAIESLTIPASVTSIHPYAFELMGEWADDPIIIFEGDAPTFDNIEYAFAQFTGKVYYPAGNSTWTEEVIESFTNSYNDITWVAYTSSSDSENEETTTAAAAAEDETTTETTDETETTTAEASSEDESTAVGMTATDNSGNSVNVYVSEDAAEAAGETGAYLVITATTETIDLTDTDIAALIASDTDASDGEISIPSLVEVYAVGDVEFPITLTFTVDGLTADNFVAVLHKVDGTWKTEEAIVISDGCVEVTVDSLSPFAFLIRSTSTETTTAADGEESSTTAAGSTSAGTGDVSTWIYVILLVAAFDGALVIARKKVTVD